MIVLKMLDMYLISLERLLKKLEKLPQSCSHPYELYEWNVYTFSYDKVKG